MSTNIFSRHKSSAGRPTYLAIQGRPDSTGAWHNFNTETGAVIVVRDGEIEHRENLGERTIAEWKAYVAAERGWATEEPTAAGAMVEA
jgi:hypothetical protein